MFSGDNIPSQAFFARVDAPVGSEELGALSQLAQATTFQNCQVIGNQQQLNDN
jgi:hypothetical protein